MRVALALEFGFVLCLKGDRHTDPADSQALDERKIWAGVELGVTMPSR